MAPRLSATDMTNAIIAEVTDDLNRTLPQLRKHSDRGFMIEFCIYIRDGMIGMLETDTWDDAWEEMRLIRPGSIESLIKQLDQYLKQVLLARLVRGHHGTVRVRVAVAGGEVGFSTKIRRQHKYDWV